MSGRRTLRDVMTPIDQRPATRRLRAVRLSFGLASFALIFGLLATGTLFAVIAEVPRYENVERATMIRAAFQVATDLAGEDPHFAANQPTGAVPICPGETMPSIKPLRLAFGLMRGTEEGLRLYEVLIDNDVCVTIDDLSYAIAYAQSQWSPISDWSESRIVVDREIVRSGGADLLAAVLVHEATHIDRAISGASCYRTDDCQLLPNGVAIDEEIAAHAAEAEWWIEAFGADGKNRSFGGYDYAENGIADAYLRGEDSFREYITRARSDTREGDDF
jgi:hypothetical protein